MMHERSASAGAARRRPQSAAAASPWKRGAEERGAKEARGDVGQKSATAGGAIGRKPGAPLDRWERISQQVVRCI